MRAQGLAKLDGSMTRTAILALLLCACGKGGLNAATSSGTSAIKSPATAVASPATPAMSSRAPATRSALAADACVATDAHGKHASQGFDCAVCHMCAGTYTFGTITFPGGTSTAGGTITRVGSTATCSVACHNPLGAQAQSIAWNAGPLQCTSCHNNIGTTPAGSRRSSHFANGSDGAACQSCHDQSRHTSGQVWMVNGVAGSSSATCTGCHSGQGQTLLGQTPPLLVGWDDPINGDFHGVRDGTCRFDVLDRTGQRTIGGAAQPCPTNQPDSPNSLRITPRWWYQNGTSGPYAWTCDLETVDGNGNRVGTMLTGQPCPAGAILNSACGNPQNPSSCYPTTLVMRGFGGALLPPYFVAHALLSCTTCHDPHGSANAFLFAAQVNGAPIPVATIDRAGVGAQALCNACHVGDRHEVCKTCHGAPGSPVDPAPDGSACFYCHGHEGILQMKVASPAYPDSAATHPDGVTWQSKSQLQCSHCHGNWWPPPTEYAAPLFTQPPATAGISATTATITWQSNERSTSYVEYGVGTAGYVAGDNVLTTQHSVTLSNLAPGTRYVWRVRSSDAFRNVAHTELFSFATTSADAVPTPLLIPASAEVERGTYTTTVPLSWYQVVAPSGSAVQYEVQLASDPAFSYLVNASMAGPGVPGLTIGDSGWISGAPTSYGGRPAVTYPATITNIPQDDCFEVVAADYYWRVRARDQNAHVSDWSDTGTFGAIAVAPWCY